MKEFWKNEWALFKLDLNNVKEFFAQPIELTLWGKSDIATLRPSMEEAQEKAETSSFWKNEWDLFKEDIRNIKDFLTQPVTLK